jgi:hypothetical protein
LAAGLPEGADVLAAAAEDSRVVAASALAEDGRFGEEWRSLAAQGGYASLLAAPLVGTRIATATTAAAPISESRFILKPPVRI